MPHAQFNFMFTKFKLFLILILSIFATVGAGIYIAQYQTSVTIVDASNSDRQNLSNVQHSQDVEVYPERSQYQNIPLESIDTPLQGTDPAILALNVFDDLALVKVKPKVEVVYPQRNQALVTITQIRQNKNHRLAGITKYRVEMTAFGRSLLVSSPPVWQIVWAGSQIQCQTGSRRQYKLAQSCH